MKINASLKNTLMLSFILLSTLPIIIIGFIALQNYQISIEKEIIEKNELLTETISSELERFLDASLSFLKQIAYVIEKEDIVSQKNMDHYLLSIINNYEFFDMIRILDKNGRIWYHVPYDENIQGLDMSLQDFFKKPMQNNEIFWSKSFISSQTSQPTLTLSLPFKYGVIVGHLNLSGLLKITEKIKIETSGFAFIVDSDGTIIAHPNKKFIQERMNINNLYTIAEKLSEENYAYQYEFSKKNKILTSKTIPQTKWTISISQKKSEAFSSIIKGSFIIIAGSIITIILALIIGYISLQKILKPLLQLSMNSQRFAAGDYTQEKIHTSYSEINNLSNNFIIMKKAIKNREDELKKHRDDLEKEVKIRTVELASANKELESFNYSVSHDLRAPLRSLAGFAKALYDDYYNKLDEEGRDFINRIISASHKMNNLTNSILKLSRITRKELRIKKINLSSIIHKILIDIKNDKKNRNINFIIAENIIAKGDESLIEIALQNLISNAIKYTSKVKKPKIEFGIKNKKDTNIFFIKDNGAGFNMKFKDNLFLPFKRLHNERDFMGTGIGLSIVNRIISKHRGNIWAESQEGKGSVFYFTLNSH